MSIVLDGTSGITTPTIENQSGVLTLKTGGTTAVTIDASQNVGIGLTSPILNSVLSIAQRNSTGNGSSTLTLDHYYANNKYIQFSWYGTNIGSISQASGTFIVIDSPALAFQTGSIERMRINSSGYITKPYQPMASVNYTGASTGAFNPILYNNVWLNDGNCYNSSTGRFTCPVAGRYRVQANDMSQFQAATGCYLIVNKNGSAVSGNGYSRADGVAHNHASITAIIQCAVGDYLTLQQVTSSYGNGYNHATFEFIG